MPRQEQDASKEKIESAIKKLNDANPQHRIMKKRLQARLEALENNEQQQQKQPRRKRLRLSPTSKVQSDSEQQSLIIDQENPPLYQQPEKKSLNLWTIEDSLKKSRRIVDRRHAFLKKQREALENDYTSTKKAEEAISMLKEQIDHKYALLSNGLSKLQEKQNGGIMAMKEQLKCIANQNEENAESEIRSRSIISIIVQNQVTPISTLIGEYAVGSVRLFLFLIAALRDVIVQWRWNRINTGE